jgi:hypothetical protein
MKFFVYTLLVLLLFTSYTTAGNEKEQDSSYIKFLAGLSLINNTTGLTDQQKAQRYSQLIQVTGISSDSAQRFVARYYDRPDEWKKIYEKIQTVLVTYENNLKNDTISTKIYNDSKKTKPKE